MENTVLLKEVKPEGWCFEIGYSDKGKDWKKKIKKEVPGTNLLSPGKMVTLTFTKNDKTGYWEVSNVASAGDALPPPKDPEKPLQDGQGKVVKPEPVADTSRVRSMAVAYAKDEVCAGKIDRDDLFNEALDIEGYILGTFHPVYKPDWRSKYLPGSKLADKAKKLDSVT
jgi:hypothetical protein